MARKLPIGRQSFEDVRRDGYVYVDKTAYVWRLAQAGVPVFLSRPRRFGKSLLVSTMRAYFEGRRELFEGLEIERLEGDGPGSWIARPVFHFDFTGQDFRTVALEDVLGEQLSRWESAYGLQGAGYTLGFRFESLLDRARSQAGHRCVVLVDEYDKPFLDVTEEKDKLENNCSVFRAFFSVLKKADGHLRFVLLTGVTRFSKVTATSDLNQLSDKSRSASCASICGVTEQELLENFGPELDELADKLGFSREGCLEALRAQYDGYRFHGRGPSVYNPFSLFNALTEGKLDSYWFEEETPTFLVRRLRELGFNPGRLTDGSIGITGLHLSNYRVDDPEPLPLLFQAGYLTIRKDEPFTDAYWLTVPNAEVKWGLVENLLPAWAPGYSKARGTDVFSLLDRVEAGDTDGMRDILAALFASIPYTRADDPFENYFQAVLWLTFALLGRYVSCEVRQARGRVDVVIEATSHVYVVELKRDGTAAEALAQVGAAGYAAPFAADPRELHLVGCAFDSETRLLSDWAVA